MTTILSYTELIKLSTFEERFNYLATNSTPFEITFGSKRWLNQVFYTSDVWKAVKKEVILRDNACDLGLEGYDICGTVYVHHINPITAEDIINRSKILTDPENLICSSFRTHNALHFSDITSALVLPAQREANDTCPWRR